MCGILGFFKKEGEVEALLFQKMLSTLSHRGPDGEGFYFSQDRKRALGHRRLSFLDLSKNGKQPMSNHDETVWITFNGEIYNFIELKQELSAHYQFKTETDSEVIIAAYETWGIDFISRLEGMFAMGILDQRIDQLYLVRDRFGIKPLYYGIQENDLVFASELKAIIASQAFEKKLNKSAISDYFVYRYVPSPKTIWENIFKLPPAHYLKIDLNRFSIEKQKYWDLSHSNHRIESDQLVTKVGHILQQSVQRHLRADVPIGAFLSGGYDSSALALWMSQHQSPSTFSIGFDNWGESEHQYAATVAEHLSLKNENIIVGEDSLDEINKMPEIYDEPIADISIIPTYLVSQLASKTRKAVFSGEGADEIFGGYTWQAEFFNAMHEKGVKNWLKKRLYKQNIVRYYAQSMAMGWFDQKELKKLLHAELHASIPEDVHWFYRQQLQKNTSPYKTIQYLDMKCFMGELVLTKIDRASMANSLEVRVPFLDHHLFELIFSIDENDYISSKQTKQLLYQQIHEGLPQSILNRKKQGFVGPDSYYMNPSFYQKELKNSSLVEHAIVQEDYLNDLLKKDYDWRLWKLLVFEKWFQHWM